jgi:large subunit ribosomal protein L29
MKADKVRDLDSKALDIQLRDINDQLFHLRFQMRMGQLDGLKKYRGLRKDRARILTVLGQRSAGAVAEKAGEAARKG